MNLHVKVVEIEGLLHKSIMTIAYLHGRIKCLEGITNGLGSAANPIVIDDDKEEGTETRKEEKGKGKGKERA